MVVNTHVEYNININIPKYKFKYKYKYKCEYEYKYDYDCKYKYECKYKYKWIKSTKHIYFYIKLHELAQFIPFYILFVKLCQSNWLPSLRWPWTHPLTKSQVWCTPGACVSSWATSAWLVSSSFGTPCDLKACCRPALWPQRVIWWWKKPGSCWCFMNKHVFFFLNLWLYHQLILIWLESSHESTGQP